MKLFKEEFNALLFLYKFLGLKGELYDMAAFTYKKTSTTSMKVTGILNPQTMVINVGGEDKQLSTLLRDFADLPVEININVKDEEKLDEPVDVE